MKIYAFTFLIALLTCTTLSCNPDKDDKAAPSNDQITGKWEGNKQIELEYRDGHLISGDTTVITEPDYFILEFKTGKAFVIDLSIQGEKGHETGYYKINGDQLTFTAGTDPAETETYTFVLNGHTLELKSVETETIAGHTNKEEEHIYFVK